jgi:hypothetical protein
MHDDTKTSNHICRIWPTWRSLTGMWLNELEGCVWKWWWPNFRYWSSKCREALKKSYENIRQDMLCPVRDLNPWPPASNSNPTYSKAKLCSCVALCGTYPSCITNYTFQDLLHTTYVYAVICSFSQSWFSHDKFEHVSGKCLTTELRTKY